MANFRATAERVLQTSNFRGVANGQLFRRTLATWQAEHPQLNVEEYFVLAEVLARLARDPTMTHSNAPYLNFRYLIAKTLLEATDARKLAYAVRMAAALERRRRNGEGNQSIVSLNWDTVVERYLLDPFDWMTDTVNFRHRRRQEANKPVAARVPLMKLHGSLAWWSCTSCQVISWDLADEHILRQYESAAPLLGIGERLQCSSCRDKGLEPAFIPPTSQKLASNSAAAGLYRHIWQETQARLLDCQILDIVGYSFPSTDIQFRVLLQDSLRVAGNIEEINIVTNKKFGEQRRQFEERIVNHFADIGLADLVNIVDVGVDAWTETM